MKVTAVTQVLYFNALINFQDYWLITTGAIRYKRDYRELLEIHAKQVLEGADPLFKIKGYRI